MLHRFKNLIAQFVVALLQLKNLIAQFAVVLFNFKFFGCEICDCALLLQIIVCGICVALSYLFFKCPALVIAIYNHRYCNTTTRLRVHR